MSTRSWKRSSARRAPGGSATARSGSSRSTTQSGCGPVSAASTRSSGPGLVTTDGSAGQPDLPSRPASSAPELGAAARQARADSLDAWLGGLLLAGDARGGEGVALVAVGGLGRRECLPHADLDLILVHGGRRDIAALAEAIWYPIWDAKTRLDHAVRTVPEALRLAGKDVKVALGLLDARFVAGDAALAEKLRAQAAADWRSAARKRLPALRELTTSRWDSHGELAFLLEGDVKEARGGLRDVAALRGIGYAQVAEAADPASRQAHARLLDVREALHQSAGRRLDRLLAEQQQPVAEILGLPGRDQLAQRVAEDARTISYACDDAWRAVSRWLAVRRWGGRKAPARRPLADGAVESAGEVTLARDAAAAAPADPTLSLRVAAAAASHELPIARATLRLLADVAPALPDPWPAPARRAFLALLGSGSGLAPAWEACDRYGLVERWLPEWGRVRSLPQRNPVHIHTVDRHLVQAATEAARGARDVSRPDLLVLAALLHDIGKGLPGDHSKAGAPIAESVCRRIGLPDADTELVRRLVRQHLLLADTATRRDLADPATIELVTGAVRDAETLDLLYALTRADAAATGPLAWSDWKAGLVAELTSRAHRMLDTGEAPAPAAPDAELIRLAGGPLPAVRVAYGGACEGADSLDACARDSAPSSLRASRPGPGASADRVAVVAENRRGLLAAVAGVLAVHRLEVLSADAISLGGKAMVECAVRPAYGRPPDAELLVAELRRAAAGELSVTDRVLARDRSHRPGVSAPAARDGRAAAPRVVWLHQASSHDTVLELRAADSPGLLYRVAHALEETGAQVRAARISTLGGDVVDSFYLIGEYPNAAHRAPVESAVLTAAAPPL
ncbi:MAG: [protein-PII] uridylyltransferase [Micromonosporaceae bacterium]|nr:[protein-PII] uridylyltransferase [Micromonosporaceae bacterium]